MNKQIHINIKFKMNPIIFHKYNHIIFIIYAYNEYCNAVTVLKLFKKAYNIIFP